MKKVKDYLLLIKPSLTIMVVFSSVMSFALTPGSENFVDVIHNIKYCERIH